MDKFQISKYLPKNMWGQIDLRDNKGLLFENVVDSISKFKPISAESYQNNPIQLIDFFSGAGGTSLGFAALNSVVSTVLE